MIEDFELKDLTETSQHLLKDVDVNKLSIG